VSTIATTVPRARRQPKWRRNLGMNVTLYAVTIFFALFALFPFVWMVSTSLKDPNDVFVTPPQWIPQRITLDAYYEVFSPTSKQGQYIIRYIFNSFLVSTTTTVLAIGVALPAAYAFSRFGFPGRDPLFFAVLCRNMFPLVVFLIPLFFMMKFFGLIDTYPVLIITYLTFGLPLSIWLMKGFFDNIPEELERSARIDGCSRFGAFWRIIVPLSSPGIVATAIFSFIGAWNEYVYALTFTNSTQMRTLPVGLTYYFDENRTDWTGLMALATVLSVPVVVFFLILQRWFIRALTEGAIKA
jgi:multiple sugar transport system permease protein